MDIPWQGMIVKVIFSIKIEEKFLPPIPVPTIKRQAAIINQLVEKLSTNMNIREIITAPKIHLRRPNQSPWKLKKEVWAWVKSLEKILYTLLCADM